ncbi:hypothetical protein SAMN04487995_5974 [Dyadobacter koreensis]|uniref:DUF2306 domain-containing protein n=1 Tax=Dyadobacter koreensis TaxID=408657 RepID=A0A1H7AZJ0_9BACT|nr:hypothetical protein [Dyadobacter koreensis]SEJ69337.1 hypothetical protein SAMN04487995_5974 [Dyadobacter koreensis]
MQALKILIYIHAFFGGLGLIAGIISIFGNKGGIKHRRTGKIFSYSMLISSLISLVIAKMPGHENLFLFLIGIFTIYLILAGNRALSLKSKTKADLIDKLISGTMLVTSIGMLGIGMIGVIQGIDNSILYIFFGCFGAFMTVRDFLTFKIFTEKKSAWLISHVGRMVGALIASITAFLVAGLHIGTVSVWILPTILGTGYIIFWNKKIIS